MFKKTNDPKEVFKTINMPIQFEDTVYLNGVAVLKFSENGIEDLVPNKK